MATKILVWDYGYLWAGERVHALMKHPKEPNAYICTTDGDDGHITIPVHFLADDEEHFRQLRDEEKRQAETNRGRYSFESVWLTVNLRR